MLELLWMYVELLWMYVGNVIYHAEWTCKKA